MCVCVNTFRIFHPSPHDHFNISTVQQLVYKCAQIFRFSRNYGILDEFSKFQYTGCYEND
jgi:hypothetical protein